MSEPDLKTTLREFEEYVALSQIPTRSPTALVHFLYIKGSKASSDAGNNVLTLLDHRQYHDLFRDKSGQPERAKAKV